MTERQIFFEAIEAESARQDRLWGGSDDHNARIDHDDDHSRRDWIAFICREASKADRCTPGEFETQMVQVAALAMAAYESIRRRPR